MFCSIAGYVGEGDLQAPENWKKPCEPAPEISWYRLLFATNESHCNFFGKDTNQGNFAISTVLINETYHILIRTQEGVETYCIEQAAIPKKRGLLSRFKSKKKPEYYAIIAVKPEFSRVRLYESFRDVTEDLLQLEAPDVFEHKYRVGLVYSQENQSHETEIFCNVDTSPDFEEFMHFLGNIIELKDWPKYQGGLDTATGKTGTHSLFTEYDDNEIMWHVPTLMPFFANDNQQLERKKHVGNDRAVIIFKPEGSVVQPDIIASRALHLCIGIQPITIPDDPETYYRVSIVYKDSVPCFGPEIHIGNFKKDQEFKDLLLQKLVNGIQATSHAKEFQQLMGFKYKHLLNVLCEKELAASSGSQ